MNSTLTMVRVKNIVQDPLPQNRIMEFYLNSFRKRLDRNESFKIILLAHFFTFGYIFLLIKYGISLVIDFDYEIKLYLYDLSVIIGGIPKYNKIYLIFVWIL